MPPTRLVYSLDCARQYRHVHRCDREADPLLKQMSSEYRGFRTAGVGRHEREIL